MTTPFYEPLCRQPTTRRKGICTRLATFYVEASPAYFAFTCAQHLASATVRLADRSGKTAVHIVPLVFFPRAARGALTAKDPQRTKET